MKLFDCLERKESTADALHAIGNLASDSVDPNAGETRELVREGGGYHKVLDKIWEKDDERVLIYALGALRNLTTFPEYPAILQETGAVERITELSTTGETLGQTLATACLANMRVCELAAKQEAEEKKQAEEERKKKEREQKRDQRLREAQMQRMQPLQWLQAPNGEWWAQAPDGQWQTRQQWEEQKQKFVQDPPSLRLDVNGLNGYTAMKETMKEMGERPAPRAPL